MATWAKRIRLLRARLRMTQEEFAKECEVDRMTVSRWERGVRHPRGRAIVRVLMTLEGKQ